MKKYKSSFYTKLPQATREAIYQGAMTLGAGFLSYDSTMVAGTGGGPIYLLGRILSLQTAHPWLVRIATDMAVCSGLIDFNHLGDAPDGSWEEEGDLTLDKDGPDIDNTEQSETPV